MYEPNFTHICEYYAIIQFLTLMCMHYLSKIQYVSGRRPSSYQTRALIRLFIHMGICRAFMNLQGWIIYRFFANIVVFRFFTGVLNKLDDVKQILQQNFNQSMCIFDSFDLSFPQKATPSFQICSCSGYIYFALLSLRPN